MHFISLQEKHTCLHIKIWHLLGYKAQSSYVWWIGHCNRKLWRQNAKPFIFALVCFELTAAFFISESWLGKTHRYTPGIATEKVIYRKLKISFFFYCLDPQIQCHLEVQCSHTDGWHLQLIHFVNIPEVPKSSNVSKEQYTVNRDAIRLISSTIIYLLH